MAAPLNKLQQQVFQVFYRDYPNAAFVASTSPKSMLSTNIAALAEQILQHPDSFLGLIDGNDAILQLSLDDAAENVLIELIQPDQEAGHCEIFDYPTAIRKLAALPAQFNQAWLLKR